MGLIGSLVGTVLNNNAAGDAADAQREAGEQSLEWIRQVYGDAQGNYAPYLGLGQSGANGLQALAGGDYSGFYNSPDYKSAREAMNYGMDHSAAAKGSLFSGGYQADLSAAQGNLANGYLSNYRNGLFNLAQLGSGAAGGLGSIGTQSAQMAGSAYGAMGDASANAALSRGNNWNNFLGQANQFGSYFGGFGG